MKMTEKMNRKKAGFTLVELMVVAIIVAILAAVAIPLMSGNKKRAAATEAQAAISSIWTAERMYYADKGAYVSAPSPVDTTLPGINANDLMGKYFDHSSYSVVATATTLTITANQAAVKSDGISGTVVLTVTIADNTSEWSGTLLN